MATRISVTWLTIRISEHARDTLLENKQSATVEYPAEMKYSIISFYIAEVMDNIHTHHGGNGTLP
jgi:hypothetical protein